MRFLSIVCAAMLSIGAFAQGSYKGFVDLGYTVGVGDYDMGRVVISTSHGYQFNPYIYLGAGVAMQFAEKYSTENMLIALDERKAKTDIPLFANFRANVLNKNVTPFVDAKLGYFLTNNGQLYASISAGCRIKTVEKQAVNISVGYSYEQLEFDTFSRFTSSSSMKYTRSSRVLNTEGIAIKIGYEF